MNDIPEDAILIGAMTFFEKQENVETQVIVANMQRHLLLNLKSLLEDEEVSSEELTECILSLKNLIHSFELLASTQDIKGITKLLKDLGIEEER